MLLESPLIYIKQYVNGLLHEVYLLETISNFHFRGTLFKVSLTTLLPLLPRTNKKHKKSTHKCSVSYRIISGSLLYSLHFVTPPTILYVTFHMWSWYADSESFFVSGDGNCVKTTLHCSSLRGYHDSPEEARAPQKIK